ncbi:MAG: hypothetical protein K2Y18_03225 [Alphaproteobacteria bacterium]|jgi:hypothetical protein|nr:hypothetical protein [Alphaproteobacteria bacterium]
MKISKILTVAIPFTLVGCDLFNDDSDNFYPAQPAQPPAHGAQAPAPKAAPKPRRAPQRAQAPTAYQPQDPQQLVTPQPAPARPARFNPQYSKPKPSPETPTFQSPRTTPSSPQGQPTSGSAPSSPPLPPTLPAPHPSSPDPDWNPNEGHIVKAGELVMELKGENGGVVPKYGAMISHIQTKMNLNAHQAEKVLEELGIEKS